MLVRTAAANLDSVANENNSHNLLPRPSALELRQSGALNILNWGSITSYYITKRISQFSVHITTTMDTATVISL